MLIPLLRAKKAIIIGDQQQLPPVINPILYDEEKIDLEERFISENELFCHSFFERLYENAPDSCKKMLDTQYRMPEVIGNAISLLFYNNKLKNGPNTKEKKPILFESNLSFINYDGDNFYHEIKENKEISNVKEAIAVVSLISSIRKRDHKCSIAIITPYKGQKRLISNTLISYGIHFRLENIMVDTIDSFQGSEADIVIFCTTRSIYPTLFFKDTRRINVALSRAKRELIILGKMQYFYSFRKSDSCLPALADYIKKNGSVLSSINCSFLKCNIGKPKQNEKILSLNSISLPSNYFMIDIDNSSIQAKIEEYYSHGDFLNPLEVVKKSSKYILHKKGFAQFRAAQGLNLSACLCRLL